MAISRAAETNGGFERSPIHKCGIVMKEAFPSWPSAFTGELFFWLNTGVTYIPASACEECLKSRLQTSLKSRPLPIFRRGDIHTKSDSLVRLRALQIKRRQQDLSLMRRSLTLRRARLVSNSRHGAGSFPLARIFTWNCAEDSSTIASTWRPKLTNQPPQRQPSFLRATSWT